MRTDYFIISHKNNKFKASIRLPEKVFSDYAQEYYIEFGGKYKCVDITLTENEDIAWLTGIKHHPKCLLNAPLQKGNEGTVLMLNLALHFLKQKFKFVKYIYLTDSSYIKLAKNQSISLIAYYIIKYKTSWYGKYFDAYPKNTNDIETINIFLDSSNEITKYSSYKDFFNQHILGLSKIIDSDVLDILKKDKKIHKYFKKTKTIRRFLLFLEEKYEKHLFQSWVLPLFPTKLEGTTWIIDISSLKHMDFIVEKTDESFNVRKKTNNIFNVIGGKRNIIFKD